MRTVLCVTLGAVVALAACARTPSVVYIEQISPPPATQQAAFTGPAGPSGNALQAP